MLGDENRMSTPGRLASIVRRKGWSEPASDQLLRLDEDAVESPTVDVRAFGGAKSETTPERGPGERGKDIVEWTHAESYSAARLDPTRFALPPLDAAR